MLRGLTTANATPENLARAAAEAVLCSLADAVDCLRPCGITPGRIVLTGGAARSEAVRAIAPGVFGLPVTVPEAARQYVALGAAPPGGLGPSGGPPEPPVLAGPAVGILRGLRRARGPRAVRRPAGRRRRLAGGLTTARRAGGAQRTRAKTTAAPTASRAAKTKSPR